MPLRRPTDCKMAYLPTIPPLPQSLKALKAAEGRAYSNLPPFDSPPCSLLVPVTSTLITGLGR